jgi:hypothetical protein
MPQSAFPVGLAQKDVPQKHSTSVLFVYNTVVLGVLPENHPFHKAVDHYASAADAIHGYLLTPE